MVDLGAHLPTFTLTTLDGTVTQLTLDHGRITVLVFWSAECPWCRKYDAWFNAHAQAWAAQGIDLCLIAASVNEDDAFVRAAHTAGVPDCVLYRDPPGVLAEALGATHTPHVFICDARGVLVYRGALDDCTFRQRTATRNYLDEALNKLQAGLPPDPGATQPYGCALVLASAWEGG